MVEGARLEIAYSVLNRIVGSNPTRSASLNSSSFGPINKCGMALPDPDTALLLLQQAPGPSPWSCKLPVPSALGSLTWKQVDGLCGVNVLQDPEGLPRLVLPMYVWFQVLDEGWMLIWQMSPTARGANPESIVVHLINVDHLRVLADLRERFTRRLTLAEMYSVPSEFCVCAEISTAYAPGKHELSLPPAFDRVPEFFVVTQNPALPKAPGAASICIYAVDPAAQRIEIYPQDWFNDGSYDYAYQWIACATREPVTRRLLVGGFRIEQFILDEAGCRTEQQLTSFWTR